MEMSYCNGYSHKVLEDASDLHQVKMELTWIASLIMSFSITYSHRFTVLSLSDLQHGNMQTATIGQASSGLT